MIETKLISKELSELVSWSVSLLGKAIKTEYGEDTFNMIEKIRQDMKSLRAKPADTVYQSLSENLEEFHQLSDTKIHQLCNSYSLMLELINRCETAYRAHRLQNKPLQIPENIPRMIIFVLTAHPTEARSPEILGLFESMQELLIQRLSSKKQRIEHELYHLLIMSLKVALARQSKPSVREEANNIYSYILKEEILDTVVDFSRRGVHVAFRTWVGGDKDGHPGVDENTLHESLSMSRQRLIEYIDHKFSRTIELLRYVNSSDNDMLLYKVELVREQARLIQELKANDGVRLTEFKKNFNEVAELYEEIINDKCPELDAISRLMWIFPALVVPLEVREDSGVVKGALESDGPYAITKMLMKLKALANGYDEKWYVRALVLSMVMDSGDVKNGLKLTKMALGGYNIPVVPLFENEQALTSAKQILTEYLDAHDFVPQKHKADWGERFEVMVGYSDSSKENGVLPSRVMISNALREIETTLQGYGLTPIFFHGSGGSIERGGGAIKEQTGWWPKSAINTFKATIQGEMVARSFSSEHVLTKQIETILSQLGDFKDQEIHHSEALLRFSGLIREKYSQKIKDSDFLNVIQFATPYSFLHHLKIGSRPSKRAGGSIEKGLRAIPWILCWTQTRILFPTWWGVGSAWKELTNDERQALKDEYHGNTLLSSYVKALGFTLAKTELGIWKLYLVNSSLDEDLKASVYQEFETELGHTIDFFKELSGEEQYLWFRPWLQESIDLRSAMIHPLNLCQLESLRRGDNELLCNSVTGIACGMLTTG